MKPVGRWIEMRAFRRASSLFPFNLSWLPVCLITHISSARCCGVPQLPTHAKLALDRETLTPDGSSICARTPNPRARSLGDLLRTYLMYASTSNRSRSIGLMSNACPV